jgi:hypothetical protein
MTRLKNLWDALWFDESSATMLRATRAILCLQALWLLLSRPDLPDLVSWPHAFFAGRPAAELARFAIGVFPPDVEWSLYRLLHAALLLALSGFMPRLSTAISGLLLYHFAPFEEIIVGMPHTFFGGLTVPTLGLLILSFARQPGEAGVRSPEYRWPVTAVQLLFTFNYFFAGIAKLRFGHLQWFTGGNIRNWAIENWAVTTPPWSLLVADSMVLCWMIAISTFVIELFFPLVLVSRNARRLFVPMAFVGHVGIVKTLGIMFPSAPLLLLFVNWDFVTERLERLKRRADADESPASSADDSSEEPSSRARRERQKQRA